MRISDWSSDVCSSDLDRFNFAPYNLLLTPSERKSVFGQVRFDFTPTFSGHAKVLYNQRESANQAAPEPFFLGTDAGVYNDYAERTLVISALNPYNPFGFDLTTAGPDANLFLLGRRPVEGGPRRYQQEVKTWYASAGVEGMFEVATRPWSWDASVVFSRSRAEQRSEEHTSELQSLMRLSYAVFCLTNKKTHSRLSLDVGT